MFVTLRIIYLNTTGITEQGRRASWVIGHHNNCVNFDNQLNYFYPSQELKTTDDLLKFTIAYILSYTRERACYLELLSKILVLRFADYLLMAYLLHGYINIIKLCLDLIKLILTMYKI